MGLISEQSFRYSDNYLSAIKVCFGPPDLRRALNRDLCCLAGLRFNPRPPLFRRLRNRRSASSRKDAFLHGDNFAFGGVA
jgi:hypothetical protein